MLLGGLSSVREHTLLNLKGEPMKRISGFMTAFVVAVFMTGTVEAQTPCPPEVAKAKEQLKMLTAESVEMQAPRVLEIQAPRGQEIQAPRGQEIQAPRGQEIQAPRGQEIQAPRGQEIQAPRGQEIQAPRSGERPKAGSSNAYKLVKEAEDACAKGDMAMAKAKAQAALAEMKE
jgi:hypothetical protein